MSPGCFTFSRTNSKASRSNGTGTNSQTTTLTSLTSAAEKLTFSTDTVSYAAPPPVSPTSSRSASTHSLPQRRSPTTPPATSSPGNLGGKIWGFGKRWDSVSTLVSDDNQSKLSKDIDDEPRDKVDTTSRLADLRKKMLEEKLDYYVVPSEDAHQSEYVAPSDRRREWISGFSGSAGTAVISANSARLFTDSRYWTQATRELDPNWTLERVGLQGSKDWVHWLAETRRGSVIGVDSRMVSHETATTLSSLLLPRQSRLTYPRQNLIDLIWRDRPLRPKDPIFIHPLKYSGREANQKLSDIRRWIRSQAPAVQQSPTASPKASPKTSPKPGATSPPPPMKPTATLISQLSSIAYILNLRGNDVPFNPVFQAYLLVAIDRNVLFIEASKVTDDVRAYLKEHGVSVRDYGDVWPYLRRREWGEGKILINPQTPYAVSLMATSYRYTVAPAYVDQMKCIKNETEIQGFKDAYLRDAVAVVRWMAWLDNKFRTGYAITEWEAAERLTRFRKEMPHFMGLAYENISASGANAALPHYSPARGSSQLIDTKTPYLNDSGGQYLDGTCDTTRTMHFGQPTSEQCDAYTRVLQGHIAIDTAIFPSGTTGAQLDVLARNALWKDGLNYLHGTGHGFGSFLTVHEGQHAFGNAVPLQPGHVLTNEPGYYQEGQWGIRIESALVVRKVETRGKFGGDVWLGFERFTQVPIQTKMVKPNMLTKEEQKWLKDHNNLCRQRLEPILTQMGDTRAIKWLKRECMRTFGSEHKTAAGLTIEWDD